MKKENVEMIAAIRKYIIDSLKKDGVTPAHEPLARLVLEHDYQESEYDKSQRENEQAFDITFSMPSVDRYESILKEMKKDNNFEKLIRSMTISKQFEM